jgi:two-component sensor histidine kinase
MDRLPAVRRLILADRPPWSSLAWSAGAVAASTALRWAIDRGEAGIPFVTYFPAVVLVALLLGWRWGALVALASGVVSNRVFRPEPLLQQFSARDAVLVALFALSCAALVVIAEMARRLVRELQMAKEREVLLNQELAHRVKNMVATVSAMAVLTARHSEPEVFAEVLGGRLEALKQATELLDSGEDPHCELHRLVETALAPFRSETNLWTAGPPCELPRDACVPLALALYELATNAAKYGAFSVPEGQVSLLWTVGEGEENLLRLVWREAGGPKVEKPKRAGMGTQLLRRQRGLKFVKVHFRRDGVRCEIAVADVVPAGLPIAA